MNYKLQNIDAAQRSQLDEGRLLPVMEEFYTIQGEGFNTGKAAYFIRIGDCNIKYHWCDVKESWDASIHPLTKADDVVTRLLAQPAKSVVITGGEPLMYNLDYLTGALKKAGIETFIETSGAYTLSGAWDWICLSPKKTMPPLDAVYSKANELKIIVYNRDDFRWAEAQAKKVNAECYLYLQPEWSRSAQMLPFIIDYVKQQPQWMISLQTHKYMNIP